MFDLSHEKLFLKTPRCLTNKGTVSISFLLFFFCKKKKQIQKSNQKNPFSELPGPIPMIFGPKKRAFALVFDFSFLGSNADVDICQKTRHSHSRSKITNSRILVSRRVDGLGKCFHRQNN